MDEQTQNIIKQQMTKLPQDILSVLENTDFTTIFQSIGKKYALMVDQIGSLNTEAMLIMIGLEHPDRLIGNIQGNIGVSYSQAVSIANDVNELVFKNIQQSLRKLHEKKNINDNDIPSQFTKAEDNGPKNENKIIIGELEENLDGEKILSEIENPSKATGETIKSISDMPIAMINKDSQKTKVEWKDSYVGSENKTETNTSINSNTVSAPTWVKSLENNMNIAPKPETVSLPKKESMGINILEDKMSGIVHLPGEVEIHSDLPVPAPAKATVNTPSPAQIGKYKIDPYREIPE